MLKKDNIYKFKKMVNERVEWSLGGAINNIGMKKASKNNKKCF